MSRREPQTGRRRTVHRWWLIVWGGIPLAMPSPAYAHLVTTGLGPVYDGFLHFVLTPEDLVPVLALALLAGLRGSAHGRWALFILPGGWMLGGWMGLAAHGTWSPALAAIPFILLGALVAADAPLPLGVTSALAAALGLWRGYLNGAAMVKPGPGALGLLGVAVAAFALVAVTAAVVVSLRPVWARVVVRVAGSWIAAVGLLLLGWGFHRGA